ncbi:class I SAM-dependent methyltransferase [Sphingomonas sp. URHD0057]|uniref:class I SAM-dependent methyltransferase n=1 Tax=Sphingomonas sp. URHD0057 TaxID=1380389 RepID=UPI00048C692F|nr:class I SAM-dependent methyltransferase [Sphingomonas sp. URHD0057]
MQLGTMNLRARLSPIIKAARLRRALWVRAIDAAGLLRMAEGRARLWTRLVYRRELHQTAPYTWLNRYPALFDLAAELEPDARRILSFGCSTGEELVSLRGRFAHAEIVGAEINPRSRAIAQHRVAADAQTRVIPPESITGSFDLVFALSVLQRDPRGLKNEMEAKHLAARYPFARFDAGVRGLVACLRPGGFLIVANTLYRVEDSSVAVELEPIVGSPGMNRVQLTPRGRRLAAAAAARTVFRRI